MKTLLVATDLSERSVNALQRAAMLAKQFSAVLHILHVVDTGVSPFEAIETEARVLDELRNSTHGDTLFATVETRFHVAFGSAGKCISQLAEDLAADLVISGAHQNRGLRDLLGGSTLHRIAKTCKYPLLVVLNSASRPYSKVIIGMDFSDGCRRATDLASLLSPAHPLTLIHAYRIPNKALAKRVDEHGDLIARKTKQSTAQLRQKTKAFIATLTPPDGSYHRILREGGAQKVLCSEALSRKADLLGVGSHGKPALVEAILGSTAYKLLNHPPCDLLIAPAP